MQKKLTITVDEAVYDGLHRRIGRGRISQFIENLVRPHVVKDALSEGYAAMARDEQRESKALAWSENIVGDVADDSR